jgi:sphingomyelin phosphodiesterase
MKALVILTLFIITISQADLTCETCKLIVGLTRDYVVNNPPIQNDIKEVIAFFCQIMHSYGGDYYVCRTAMDEFAPLVFYLLTNENTAPDLACSMSFINLCPPLVFPKWNVTLSPKPPMRGYPGTNPSNPRIKVLHITDVHVDMNYTIGLSNDCGEPICCRPPNPVGKPGHTAQKWGDYNCDSPPIIYENMLDFISKNIALNYSIFTGDVPAHYVWSITRDQALETFDYVYNTYKKYLPHVPLYPAIGNHEAVPVNEFPYHFVEGEWNINWLYDRMAKLWQDWLDPEALEMEKFGGYYTTKTKDGVRIVSLNTQMGCDDDNWWLLFPTNESSDPNNMLHWFVNVLDSAEKKNETVYLIAHISPDDGCMTNWFENFLKIMDRYQDTVINFFAGHTHDDKFDVTIVKEKNITRPVYSTLYAGSITTQDAKNPSFRVMEIDAVTKAVIGYDQYIMNITDANLTDKPKWVLEYSTKIDYKFELLSPNNIYDLANRFKSNSLLFNDYIARMNKNAIPYSCNVECRRNIYCQLFNSLRSQNIECKP